MISVCILYPRTEFSRFDVDYYVKIHMPMVFKLLGNALKSVTVEVGIAGTEPNSPPANAAVCRLVFDSVDAFLAAFMPHAATLRGDTSNYTDIAPVVSFNEVRISQ